MRPFCTKVRPFEILKFGMGKHLVLFFENKSVRPNFHGNHWRGWVWGERWSLLKSASKGFFLLLCLFSLNKMLFPALLQVSQMAVLHWTKGTSLGTDIARPRFCTRATILLLDWPFAKRERPLTCLLWQLRMFRYDQRLLVWLLGASREDFFIAQWARVRNWQKRFLYF